jgi:hypothetical protein
MFNMTNVQTQKYYNQEIMKPYIGLRILNRNNNGLYDNYKVINVVGKIVKEAYVVKVDMEGTQIGNNVETITLVKKEKSYTRQKQKYKFAFTDGKSVDVGIATNEGFRIFSLDDEKITYKSMFKTIDGVPIPEVNLVVTVSSWANWDPYIITEVTNNIKLRRLDEFSTDMELTGSLRNNEWIASNGYNIIFGTYLSGFQHD